MLDINKLKELKKALKDDLITQEEYEKLKAKILEESSKRKSEGPSLIEDNESTSAQSIHLSTILIQN